MKNISKIILINMLLNAHSMVQENTMQANENSTSPELKVFRSLDFQKTSERLSDSQKATSEELNSSNSSVLSTPKIARDLDFNEGANSAPVSPIFFNEEDDQDCQTPIKRGMMQYYFDAEHQLQAGPFDNAELNEQELAFKFGLVQKETQESEADKSISPNEFFNLKYAMENYNQDALALFFNDKRCGIDSSKTHSKLEELVVEMLTGSSLYEAPFNKAQPAKEVAWEMFAKKNDMYLKFLLCLSKVKEFDWHCQIAEDADIAYENLQEMMFDFDDVIEDYMQTALWKMDHHVEYVFHSLVGR